MTLRIPATLFHLPALVLLPALLQANGPAPAAQPPQPVSSLRSLCPCDWTGGWRTFSEGTLNSEADGVRILWSPRAVRDKFMMHELDFPQLSVGAPEELFAEVEKVRGGRVLFAPVLSGRDGWLLLAARELAPGVNQLSWRLPDDLAAVPKSYAAPLHMQEVRFVAMDTEPVELVLRSLSARQRLPAVDALRVEVDTGDPLRLVRPGNEASPVFRVHNDAEVPLDVLVNARVHNLEGDAWTFSRTFAVPAQGSTDLPLRSATPERGIWWVDYGIRPVGGDRSVAGRRSFCVMEPVGASPIARDPRQRPRPGSEFLFGVMAHSSSWGAATRQLEIKASALCGAKLMRTDIGWFTIQRDSAEDWRWEAADTLIDECLAAGIEVDFMMGYTPRWAAPEPARSSRNWVDWYRAVPDFGVWEAFVDAVAKRYHDRVRFFEVWNEPDLDFFRGSLEEYLRLLRIAHARVKAADPTAFILNGGFGTLGYHPTTKPGFQMEVMTRAQDLIDIHAIHEHCAFPEFERLVDGPHAEIRRRLDPPKPLFCNETALASLGGERDQAEALGKKLVFAWARGASAYVWFNLRNGGYSTRNVDHNYGMFTHDFYPKAIYPAYNTLVRTLRGKHFVRQLPTDAGTYAFLFADAAESVLATWTEGEKRTERSLTFAGVPSGSRLRDLMDNDAPDRSAGPVFPVGASLTPRFLIMPGAVDTLEVTGDLVAIPSAVATEDRQAANVTCQVRNPNTTPLRATLEALPEPGFRITDAARTLDVPPGGTAEAVFRVAPPTNAVLTQAIFFAPRIRYQADGGWSGAVCTPLPVIVAAANALFDERFPAFVLETHDAIVNFREKDPTLAMGGWNGPADLSARIHLFKEAGQLHVRADVRDDIHHQAEQDAEAWRGDGIQCALALPGQFGYWEMTLYRDGNGQPRIHLSSIPKGFVDIRDQCRLGIAPIDGGLRYEVALPFDAIGATDRMLDSGIRFGLIVNDNDGQGRKGWAQATRGIGEIKDPSRFPILAVPTRQDKSGLR